MRADQGDGKGMRKRDAKGRWEEMRKGGEEMLKGGEEMRKREGNEEEWEEEDRMERTSVHPFRQDWLPHRA